MGNSEQREQGMSILICGDKNAGNHFIATGLSTLEFENISLDEYRGIVVVKNDVEIESTLYIKSDLKDRKIKKQKNLIIVVNLIK